ncbi:hypothetical protein MGYG_04378 [Nannizzia gypsea CBS 118893]|uniref:Uncharacterized protein n=1 Tax=Arthroderma gypseum (strain ATCC MYA-4604 / CBS 118893) TaxID=535722 RepID=E4USM0_ARTGP|nr:hypothetical protein MGYG_04378 [Nannizzia gypsea CBS 118893]EFR01371.1 hypothetical protein MGYG_04378 [Nannizzia gypsea CBS 118893]
MATASVHSLISNEKLGANIPAVPASLHIIHPIPQTRYESDEEEESELDIPATREDQSFSTPNADCDIVIGSRATTDHAEDSFELTMPLSEEQQKMQHRRQGLTEVPKRSSVYTVRRISGLTLLPPLQTSPEQLQQHEQQRNPSRSRSPSATPRTRAERPATMIFEQEEFEDPIYSDQTSEYDAESLIDSDLGDDTDVDIQDGGPIHESFFVATPITYHLPKSRPSLVSISPPPSRSGRSPQPQAQPQVEEQSPRAQKKQKKQSVLVSLERTDPAFKRNSSTSSSIKRSLQHLKVKTSDSRRGSAYISTEPTPVLPSAAMNASPTISPMSATSPPDSAKFFTEPKKHKHAPSDTGRRRSLVPNQLRSGRRNAFEQQTPPPTDFEAPSSQKNDNNNINIQTEPQQTQNQGHRRRATEKLPTFNKVAWTPASPPSSPGYNNSAPSNYSHHPALQRLPISPVPDPIPSPGLRKTRTMQVPPPNNSLDQLNVPRTRARTRSISSIASNASKFSLPAFDSASLKAIAQKYQNRTTSPTPSASSNLRPATIADSDRRPSDCGSIMSDRPSIPLSRHNKFLRTMSTTNLSMLTSAQDTINEDTMGGPYQSKAPGSSLGRKSKRYSTTSKASVSTGRSSSTSSNYNTSSTHIRSKSMKWLQGTSESMSLAGNKLGSILKKKSVALPTTS